MLKYLRKRHSYFVNVRNENSLTDLKEQSKTRALLDLDLFLFCSGLALAISRAW
jgi:hypothetical protein